MKKYAMTAILAVAYTSLNIIPQANAAESELWKQFKSAKANGNEPTLPDFSYAGYKYSRAGLPNTSKWPVFKVREYGAIPNDGRYDDAGIQAAIDAAEENGRGIVLFEAGRYKVSPNENTDNSDRITVAGSNILLKGVGSGSRGTEIFMNKKKLKGFGWPMFVFGASGRDRFVRDVTTLTGTSRRETFVINVRDASNLKAGQHIMLHADSKELRDDELNGRAIGDNWSVMRDDGFQLREIHSIRSINGNRVTLNEPLHVTVKQSYDVDIRSIGMIENVGIEDLRFTGNWPSHGQDFVHHKPGDPVHDYGWVGVQMTHVNNGWIDNVDFKDFNHNLSFSRTSAITVSNVKFLGKKAHASVMITGSYGVLVKDSQDFAGHHHGAGVQQRNAGGVYLRYKQKDEQRIDSHGLNPYASLYDNVSNGILFGSGGGRQHYPNHMNHFVAWNFKIKGGQDDYTFWLPSRHNPNQFLNPFFVGLHGKRVNLKAGTVGRNESQNKKVEPYSLFEAQLGLRALPGYKLCCVEGSQKRFNRRVDVAYGALGKYKFIYNVTGNIRFNSETFGGDPIKGQRKSVYYRPAGPRGYFLDAQEGDELVVRSLRNIKFGANGNYVTKYNRRSNMDCSVADFGRDPAPGDRKSCYIQRLKTPHGYNLAASENQRVDVRGTMHVGFGANGQYVWLLNQRADLTCNRRAFGRDPIPGVAKSCYVRSVNN